MTIELHIYRGGGTDHIAWTIGGHYLSFLPSKTRLTDLGSRPLPLPGGVVPGHAYAYPSRFASQAEDSANYTLAPPRTFVLEGLDEARAAAAAQDLFDVDFPYILWDPTHVGAINCVTTAIMMFNIILPEDLPALWDLEWGRIFRDHRQFAIGGGDWFERVIASPEPMLTYVHQVAQMAQDWTTEHDSPFIEAGALPAKGPLPTGRI